MMTKIFPFTKMTTTLTKYLERMTEIFPFTKMTSTLTKYLEKSSSHDDRDFFPFTEMTSTLTKYLEKNSSHDRDFPVYQNDVHINKILREEYLS